MKIKVYGKAHLEGTSKRTGKPYNLNQIHYLSPARGVDGLAAQTAMLDPALYPFADIQVGADYNIGFDNHGYPVEFYPVK